MDDVFPLSRIQFALTIMFHYIFPPLSTCRLRSGADAR
jgi:cytochrome bd-type quinol oxidase subunit 1